MYDPFSDIWAAMEDCPAWVSIMFGSAVIGNDIIIPGGQNEKGEAVSSVYIYNTREDEWSRSTDLPRPIQIGGITTLKDKLFMIGGCNNDFRAYSTVYEGTWED
jgi:N-acetylneuraminic acid mutarotase